jgi:hypothetical protein
MPLPMMPSDEGGADFLDQLKTFARSMLEWINEEGQEAEHPGPTIDAQVTGDEQPPLLRTKTTTVSDFAPPPGIASPLAPAAQASPGSNGQSIGMGTPMATDPPVSEAQRRAMHAAASGNSNSGIPQSVGQKYANSDPGGGLPEKKGEDDLPTAAGPPQTAERFALSPDGRSIIDNQNQKSFPIEEAMKILFNDPGAAPDAAAPNQVEPAGKVAVNPVDTPNVNGAQWSVPKLRPPGTEDDMEPRGAGWAMPPIQGRDPLNDTGPEPTGGTGAVGKVLGKLVAIKAGDNLKLRGADAAAPTAPVRSSTKP